MNTINFIKAVKRVFALPLISWGTIICMFLLIFPAMLYSQSGEKYSVNMNSLGPVDKFGSSNYAHVRIFTNSTLRALFTADGNFEAWYDSYFKKNVTVDSTITAWEMYAMYRLSVYGDAIVSGFIKADKLLLAGGGINSLSGTVNFGSNNLATTGNITAGSFNSPSFAGSSRAMLATDTAGNIIRKGYSGNPNDVLTGDGNWSNLSQSTGWQWVDSNLVSTAAQVVVANNLAVGGKISVGQIKVISNGSNKDTLHTEKELVIITDSKNISLDADTVKIPRLLDSKRMETDTLNSKKINASKVYVAGDITSTGTVYTGNLYVANDMMLPLFAGTKNLLLTDSTGKVSPLGVSSTSNKVLLSNGTWGAVPIPQNYWQMQNDDIYTLTPGNIGLGMNNPAYKLDVAGTVRISEDLLVGGGIIISEKVNATRELKSASLRADSIFMDNTKAFYGESRFADSVKIQSKLRVDGNIDVGGDLRSSGSLIFGSNKNISYFPHQNGVTGDLCFGLPFPPAQLDPCFSPAFAVDHNWFNGLIHSYGLNSENRENDMLIGFDGSNGIIDMRGTSTGVAPRLLINYSCGKDVFINNGPNGGNIQLTGSLGKVGIGTEPNANSPKLSVNGNVQISDLTPPTGTYNVVVADNTGLLGTKDVSEIGDNMGDHTATNDIILGDNWLSREPNLQGQLKRGMHIDQNGDFTFLVDGLNSFEIKGNNRVPYRRGISIDDDPFGSLNFWTHLYQANSAFNFMRADNDDGSLSTNLLTIYKNGKVGIGTTNEPYKKLTVNGDVSFANYNTSGQGNMTDGYSGFEILGDNQVPTRRGISLDPDPNGSVNFYINSYQNPSAFNFINSNSPNTPIMTVDGKTAKVGIGTSAPEAKLHVQSDDNTAVTIVSPTNKSSVFWAINSGFAYGFGINSNNTGCIFKDKNNPQPVITFNSQGNVGIGTNCQAITEKLEVNGKVRVKDEVIIDLNGWCDYVYSPDYMLMPIPELEEYLRKHRHVPGAKSETEMLKSGFGVLETSKMMFENIEKIYLYIIQLNERIDQLTNYNKQLEKRIAELEKK